MAFWEVSDAETVLQAAAGSALRRNYPHLPDCLLPKRFIRLARIVSRVILFPPDALGD